MQIPAQGEPNLLTPSFSTARFSEILPSSSLVCPTPLQKPTKLPNTTGSVQQGVVPRYGHPRCPCSGGTKMVDMEHQTGEWQSHLPTIGRNGCDFRRLQIGVGCYMRQSVHQRALVDSGKCPPHQYIGAKGNVSGSANVSEAPVELISETSLRQHNGDSLYKQPGRDSFPYFHGSNTRSVELMHSTKHFDHGRTPSRDLEHSSRPGVTNIYRHERLEITTSIDTTIPEGKRRRSVCYKADQPVTRLCELAPRLSCSGHGRIFNKLEPSKRIRFPTIQPHTHDTDKGNKRQCKSVTISPGVANSALVATVATTLRPTSSAPTFKSVSSTGPIESQGNPSNVPETPISRMDYFQQLCSTAGLPKTATRLLASATRRSTNKTYDCAWTKWHSWCNRRKINPISATIKDILTFLSDQFDCNLQYRTVNVLRSAISSIHPWIEGKPVGQHPLVTRLMRGIANERPPEPRYSTTWDVSKVTTYLSSLGENKILALKLLTKKLLMLLALVSPQRSSVLWELDIRFLRKQPDGILFTLANPRKSGDPMNITTVNFPRFLQDERLCPCDCLETYLTVTEKFRTTDGSKKLFLSFQRPHHPVAKANTTRWICDVLLAAGIDATIFKAHSTRSASTSKTLTHWRTF